MNVADKSRMLKEGMVFNKWTILSFSHKNKYGNWFFDCQCQCGNTNKVSATQLRRGQSKQCKSCAAKINGRKGLNAMAKSHLYFIGYHGYIKIGSTDNVQRRLVDLQGCTPYKVELYYFGEDEGHLEPFFHDIFKELNINGEWFNFN